MNFSRIDEGATTTLRVRGELDALSAPTLRPLLDELVETDRRDITVDLSGLRLIDSSGVGALVSLYKRIRANGGAVRFAGVTAQPLVIFQLLRLDSVFGLAADSPVVPETEQPATATATPVRVES
ncbi:MAG TPA: STAS domain-containing protein [Polyangiaceae bacterium]|jgi:anti-sigma B factor antagonist